MMDTIFGGSVDVTGVRPPPIAGDASNLSASDFTDTTDPNGGAVSTGNSSWLGTAVQWVSQTADEVSNATYQLQDAQASIQDSYAQGKALATPTKPAPPRLSASGSTGIAIVLLAVGAWIAFAHGS